MSTAAIITGVLVKEAFEYWLGKTDKTKASSTAELVINFIKDFIKGLSGGKNGQ